MRQLILLRGVMASGKSTWVKENGLEDYTLSSDTIRAMVSGHQLGLDGEFTMNGMNESFTWRLLKEMLENRMKEGAFTIIDATHVKQKAINAYKALADEYKYRTTIVQFDVTLEEALERNSKRAPHKIVPESAIMNAYTRLETEHVPKRVPVIKPEEFWDKVLWRKTDADKYKNVYIFGDIHNSYTILKESLIGVEHNERVFKHLTYHIKELKSESIDTLPRAENFYQSDDELIEKVISEENLYIFVGDYFDRGVEPVETFHFINKLADKSNVILLEGNHEAHIKKYGYSKHENYYKPAHTFKDTYKAFKENGITEKHARMLYRKLQQIAWFTRGDKTYLVTHGGLTDANIVQGHRLDKNPVFVNTRDFIHGVGKYEDNADLMFNGSTDSLHYQVHGHRNLFRYEADHFSRSINLEGQVEYGGDLRVFHINESNKHYTYSFRNIVYNHEANEVKTSISNYETVETFLEKLNNHNGINVKELSHNTVSVNFTRKAFLDKNWDDMTVRARGLFINTEHNEIVARGYDKFFYPNERNDFVPRNLERKLAFPVSTYVKENGFLGLISYDKYLDDIRFYTKSTDYDTLPNDDKSYVGIFKDLAMELWDSKQLEFIKEYSKEHNATFTFEVIHPELDPHIIEYDEPNIVLLDVIYNEIDFKKLGYDELVKISSEHNFDVKMIDKTFKNWTEYFEWHVGIKENTKDTKSEGWVIEDSNGFMLKEKTTYYNEWKKLRGMLDKVSKGNYHLIDTRALYRPEDNRFISFLKSLPDETRKEVSSIGIIALRNMFYQS